MEYRASVALRIKNTLSLEKIILFSSELFTICSLIVVAKIFIR